MQTKTLAAGEGLGWFTCGWKLFTKNAGIQFVYVVILVLASIVLNLIPFVGGLVMALIAPVLFGGWYYALSKLDAEGTMEIQMLLEGFRDKSKRTPLVTLGAAVLVVELVAGIVVATTLGSAFVGAGPGLTEATEIEFSFGPAAFTGLLVVALLITALFMAVFYAVPLVYFDDQTPVEAMKLSFNASLTNFLPLLVFGLVYFVLAIIAAIPFGLGFFILIPVSVAAAYCSYRAIYTSPGGE